MNNEPKRHPKENKQLLMYIPHGVDHKIFRRLTTPNELGEIEEMKKKIFGMDWKSVDFVVFWNQRNIRRKMPGDVILAFQHFTRQLSQEQASRCRLVMHTQPVDDNGTDIPAVVRDCAPEIQVVYSVERLVPEKLNVLYNIADVTINLASNEGFGIGTLESITAETPIVVNVTGGLQDQCGFVDENGVYLHPDKHFNKEFGTNADRKYTTHGEWVIPCFPTQRGLIGSPQTPYIFDDRCGWKEAGNALLELYKMTPEERQRRGALGHQYAIQERFTAESMGELFIKGMDEVFISWKPRSRFVLQKAI